MRFPEEFVFFGEEEVLLPPLEVLFLDCVFWAAEEVLFFFAEEDVPVFPEVVFFLPDELDDAIDRITPLLRLLHQDKVADDRQRACDAAVNGEPFEFPL